MFKVFYQPRAVVNSFLEGVPPLVVIVPLAITTVLFEASYTYAYLNNFPPYMHFFARSVGISGHLYDLVELFLLPIMNICTIALFGLIVRLLSRGRTNSTGLMLFFAFIFGTIGIPGFVAENIGMYIFPALLNISQPIMGMAYVLYPMEYIHRQAHMGRLPAAAISIVGIGIVLGLRVLFLG